MKLHFESSLAYQLSAIKSTTSLFNGIDFYSKEFTLDNQQRILLKNLQMVQVSNNLHIDDSLALLSNDSFIPNYSIEMETGTGKTYVYLRTIFELNRDFKLNKFIIVVPSVAIREGVLKTLKITQDHFKELYHTSINFFAYDKDKLNQYNRFVDSNGLYSFIDCMVINIDSFNKKNNILHIEQDATMGEKPIDLLKKINPVVILDEPQNMTTDISKVALSDLSPKLILRYSATHKEIYNQIYSLGPVEAFNQHLVKSIYVHSSTIIDNNKPYMKVLDINKNSNKPISVNLELFNSRGILKEYKHLCKDDELDSITENSIYQGYYIENIYANSPKRVKISKVAKELNIGDTNIDNGFDLMKEQISQTIKQHFKTQKELKDKGIKVLSLFFLDKVADYRLHEENRDLGVLAKHFEEEFIKYQDNDVIPYKASDVHAGYFAKDKNGYKDTSSKDNKDDKAVYDLIMKDKEKLLSFDEKVSFIFSHSALREGWDNPNVFNICILRQNIKSDFTKRQQIGRGLRRSVNQNGERTLDNERDILHLFVNEGYESFAKSLQDEYAKDGYNISNEDRTSMVKNASMIRELTPNNLNNNENFTYLWNLIKQKTYYSVNFSNDELVKNASNKIKEVLEETPITPIAINTTHYEIKPKSNKDGSFSFINKEIRTQNNTKAMFNHNIPSFINKISAKTQLTKKTVMSILKNSCQVEQIKVNPFDFIEKVSEIICSEMNELIINGIKYHKLDNKQFEYNNDNMKIIVDGNNSNHYILKNAHKSLWEQLRLDSKEEAIFASRLDNFEDIKFFIKLPYFFKIKTPIGTYNPDFAYIKNDNEIVFIREIKGSIDKEQLRKIEADKISCATKHFVELERVDYKVTTGNDI